MSDASSRKQNGAPQTSTGARIGHVNLKVSNLQRSLAFYQGVLGFKVTKRLGDAAAFLAHGDYHHDICINTWESRGGSPPTSGTTGLFHFAIVYAERNDLRDAYERLKAAGIAIDSAVDHGVSEFDLSSRSGSKRRGVILGSSRCRLVEQFGRDQHGPSSDGSRGTSALVPIMRGGYKISGVRTCSGRIPTPSNRAGMRRSTGKMLNSLKNSGGFGRC